MAYTAPRIGAQGLTIPTYNDILEDLLASYRSIYGASVYLGNDSSDYQFLSVLALKMSDTMQSVQLAYNNRSPVSAIGAALDAIVKLNGIARKVPSFSTCQVTISGTPGTTITGGIVQDAAGNKWDLPSPITIDATGLLEVTAVCETVGAITASTGTITKIVTPTAGWMSVTNASEAVPGQPVESDYQLRARQAISVAGPSQTMLAGTIAAIAAVPGVSRYNILENPTGAVDAYGTPAHSITCVVEGGTDADIAYAIYNNRGIGCLTNGTSSVTISDPNTGDSIDIGFYRPTYKPIYVTLGVHGITGYTSATTDAIKSAVATYLNSLQIGESLTISGIYGAALSVMPNLSQPNFSIRSLIAGIAAGAQAGNDISIDFDKVTTGNVANITVNLV